jgi:hypothetical protein
VFVGGVFELSCPPEIPVCLLMSDNIGNSQFLR